MNFNLYKILIAAAALALASCSGNESKEGKIPDTGETTSVYLKIDTRGNTRADVPTASGTAATLYTALIYLVNGDENPLIYDVLTAGPGGDITMQQLEDGYLVEDVSSAVTQVYVIGNYNSVDQEGNGPTFPTSTGGRLNAVKAEIIDIQQSSYPAITGVTVPATQLITIMDGQATVQTYSSNQGGWNGEETLEGDDKYANVVISPIVARIEIEELNYTGILTSFTVEGIYVNNYYERTRLSLDFTGYAPVNSGPMPGWYDSASADFAYGYYTTLYDELDEAVTPAADGGEATVTPDNDVWAYQVFGGSNPVPHIIIRLTDVVSAGGADLDDLFVTVTGFSRGGSELMTLQRNTIYKIASITFSDDDLTPEPEPETADIWVHVEVQPWTTVNVTPIL